VDQNGGGSERSEGSKYPDMADANHQCRRPQRAREKTEIEGRHQKAGDRGRKGFDRGAHAEQRALKTVADHQKRHAQKQRPAGGNRSDHDVASAC